MEFINDDAVKHISSVQNGSVDRIFALDCIYHFSSRSRFIKESIRVLARSGKIVLTDLLLGDNITTIQRILMHIICTLIGVPYSNFKIQKEYQDDFVQAGFEDIAIEDISGDVFPGLGEFIERHCGEMRRFEIGGKWSRFLVFGRVVGWWWETGAVRFVVVHARKPTTSE